MGSIKLSIHPLFYLFGLYYGFTGRFFLFIMTTLCAVMHELGHSIVASSNGYRLDKITLMPFGAVVKGDIDGIKPKDEIKIALAGPMINLAVGIFFVAVWWIFPETYAFTDLAVQTCFSLALINLIPAYPLDGGRILYATLRCRLNHDKAELICKIVGGVFGISLLAGFVATCFYSVNLSLLIFSIFLLVGAFSKKQYGKYVKVVGGVTISELKRGVAFKKQGVDENITIKRLIRILEPNAINEVVVYSNGKQKTTLSQEKINNLINNHSIYQKISQVI